MYKKLVLSLLFLVFFLSSATYAKNITWVAMDWDADNDGVVDSNDWVEKLIAEGYDVDFQPGYWDELTQEKVDELNQADLVIFSATIQSNVFGGDNPEEADLWNSVTAPMLCCSPYILRSNRWKWVNIDGDLPSGGDQGAPDLEAVQPGHPIFYGVTLENGKVQAVDSSLGSGHASFVGTDDVGNGVLIAKAEGNDWLWIAEWQEGVEFYSGSGTYATAHRMYMSIGYHENSDGDYDARGYNLTDEGWEIYLNTVRYMLDEVLSPGIARSPNPANGEKDIFNNPVLTWKPGLFAIEQDGTHNVFFSSDFNDVNNATVSDPLGAMTSFNQALDANSFIPGALEYGTTYYWRVDEVNNPSSLGQTKGNIWSFTIEPVALNFPYANFEAVTAISSLGTSEPNETVNGEGLDPNFPDQHSGSTGSWASDGNDDVNDGIWIQYDFDQQYKIHQMLVWNYNHRINKKYGFKDVLVQYSADGQTWVDINDVNQFAKADGGSDYVYNTVVDFNDAVVKSVRITAFSNWGTSKTNNYGLSEVRFTYIPVRARRPSPADEAENVAIDTLFTWRKGREADSQEFFIDTNESIVLAGGVSPVTLSASSYSPTLALNKTYYWKVDSISYDDTPSIWEGNVWSLSTPTTIIVDNFEVGYGDTGTDAVYLTWKDAEELGNKTVNGSVMGRSKKPYLQTINHSGSYSAPMKYDTLKHSYAEVIAQTIDLPIATSDWSFGSPSTLTIWFRGDPNATEVGDSQLYCTLGGKKAVYGGSIDALTRDMWRQWDIDLNALGANLSNVAEIIIGIEKIGSVGGSGVIYLDDIALTGFEPMPAYPDYFVEAEAFDSIDDGPMEVNNVTDGYEGASGGEYIQVANGTAAASNDPPANGICTYEVPLDGGQYVIWGRVSIPTANQDAFWVKVEGAEADVDLHSSEWCRWNIIPAGEEWHWDDVHSTQDDDSTPTVTWTIPAGTTTISIAYRDTGANPPRLDCLVIQKVGE